MDKSESIDEPNTTDWGTDEQIGVAIVEAVSSFAGVDPCQLDAKLYDVVDPDALGRTIRTGGPELQISFRFDGYDVFVSGTGEIVVDDPSTDTS